MSKRNGHPVQLRQTQVHAAPRGRTWADAAVELAALPFRAVAAAVVTVTLVGLLLAVVAGGVIVALVTAGLEWWGSRR